MQGDASIRPDGILAQLRAGAARTIQNDEHLAALGRDLDAEPGSAASQYTVSDCGIGNASITLFVNFARGMERKLLAARYLSLT
jgi:hypothetical protein